MGYFFIINSLVIFRFFILLPIIHVESVCMIDLRWCLLANSCLHAGNNSIHVPHYETSMNNMGKTWQGEKMHDIEVVETHAEKGLLNYLKRVFWGSKTQTNKQSAYSVKARENGLATASPLISISSAYSSSLNVSVLPGLYVYKTPYHLSNIGHVLGDDIWAIFSALYFWNLHMLHSNKLWIVLPETYKTEFQSKSVIGSLFQTITPNKIIFVSSQDHLCFQHLLTGWSGLTYSYNDRPISVPSILAFKRKVMQALDINIEHRNECEVLFIEKDLKVAEHKFSIVNVDELISYVNKFSTCSASKITWQGMELRDQIAKISAARIVVSLPGSDIMNCIFQPIYSGLLVPDRCDTESKTCEGSNEIRLWYSKIPGRHFRTFGGNLDSSVKSYPLKWSKNSLTWDPDHLLHEVRSMNIAIELEKKSLSTLQKLSNSNRADIATSP